MSDDGFSSNGGVVGMKRPAADDLSYPNSEKRAMVVDKVAAAAEAAARLNQKLGGGAPPQSNPSMNPSMNPIQPGRPTITETTEIPDRYVGLVIGKKGEQIMSLQNESACKVQISQAGTPERTVTLTGTPQQIEHAKQLISDIIDKAEKNGPSGPNGQPSYGMSETTTVEMSIPGMKAGLIIGRGGETIKNLQEENNVKMVLIQQSNAPTGEDKPLRISGDPANVEKVRMTILNLLNTRDVGRPGPGPMHGGGGGGGGGGYGGEESTQCAVPAEKAGLVIGKGGSSIKEICGQSGAHVEISKDPSPDPTIKLFNVRGSRSSVDQAIRLICDRVGIPASRSVVNSGGWGQYGGGGGYPQSDPWSVGANGAAPGMPQQNVPSPSVNPSTGQLDYSAAWADYYRKHGMNEFADAIIRQGGQPGGQPNQMQPNMVQNQPVPQAQPQAVPQMPVQGAQPQGQQIDYNQWQWQQWQAWQQAWQQSGNPGQPPAGQYPPQAPNMPPGRPHMPEQ